VNEDNRLGITFYLDMEYSIDLLDMEITDISRNDFFRYEATINMLDGSSFSSANTGPNLISQPTFASLFRLSAKVY